MQNLYFRLPKKDQWIFQPLVSLRVERLYVKLLFTAFLGIGLMSHSFAQADLQRKKAEKNTYLLASNNRLTATTGSAGKVAANVLQVTGTVTDDNGAGLPGVSILLKGTTTGTATDANGKYSLAIPDASANGTLIFSYIGYVTEEVAIGSRTVIDVKMLSDVKALGEVVVIGYGTQKRSDVTGSISSISEKEITESRIVNVDQALQGRMAGVQVSTQSGRPGANMSVQIRGINSPNGNEPLYVIDGIPVGNGGGSEHLSKSLQGLNTVTDRWAQFDISTLNPNDIASIDVLKDASATAIYGSLAANGVVVITTKRGKKGLPKIAFDAYYGVQQIVKEIDMLNSEQYFDLFQEARVNAGQSRFPLYDSLAKNGGYYNTNWQGEVFRPAPMQSYNLSLSGGSEKLSYFISGGMLKQDGIMGVNATDFDKYSIRLNIDSEVRPWLKLGFNVNGSATKSQMNGGQLANFSAPYDALASMPFLPVRWRAGDESAFGPDVVVGGYSGPTNAPGNNAYRRNPILEVSENDVRVNKNMIIGNLTAEFSLLKGLKYNTSIGGTYNDGYYHNWIPRVRFGREYNVTLNNLGVGRTSGNQLQFDQYATYTWNNAVHNLTAVVGHSITHKQWSTITAGRDNFLFDTRALVVGAITRQAGDGRIWENSLQSFFGRVNYSFQDKYLLTATVRRDGSSKFSYSNKYATFPAFGVGWRLSREKFMENITWLDDLKLSASWGQTGAQNIDDFAYYANMEFQSLTGFGSNNSVLVPAAVHNNIPNTNIKWETTTQSNIGLDASFLQNKFGFSVAWYNKVTDDLLLGRLPIPNYIGIGGPTVNLGTFENRGLEFQVDARNILNSNTVKWDIGFNVSGNRNNVRSIGYLDESYGSAGYIGTRKGRTYVGNPWGMYYGHVVEGIFQSSTEIEALNIKAQEQAANLGIAQPGNVRYQPNNPQPGDIKFRDINGKDAQGNIVYGKPDGKVDDADRTFIGNPHPDFFYGITTRLEFKGFDLSIFASGTQGNDIYNQNRQDFERMGASGNDALNQTTAALNRWRSPENPGDGRTPRAVFNDPNGNNRDSDRFVEDGSFFRIKNITLGYNIPQSILSKASLSNARLYITLRDYFTFTKYSWYNPDLGNLGNEVNAPGVDSSTYPFTKSIIMGVTISL